MKRMEGQPQIVFTRSKPVKVRPDRFVDGRPNDDKVVMEQGDRYMITGPIEVLYLERMGYRIVRGQ